MRIRSLVIGSFYKPEIGIFKPLSHMEECNIQYQFVKHIEFKEALRNNLIEIVCRSQLPPKKKEATVDIAKEVEKGVIKAIQKLIADGTLQVRGTPVAQQSSIQQNNIKTEKVLEKFKPSEETAYIPSIQETDKIFSNISVEQNNIDATDIDNASEQLKKLRGEYG